MNKSRLIGGLIMVGIAVALGVLYFVLPTDQMMFMIEGENLPFVPAIVLGVIGIIMLSGVRETAGEEKKEIVVDEEKNALNKKLETIAWGLFLIMVGGFAFIPKTMVPGGVWSICVGVLLVGLNLARYLNGLKMSGFTTFLGALSVLSGILQLLGLHDYEGAILLIILGSYLLVKPTIEKTQLFGKAEEK